MGDNREFDPVPYVLAIAAIVTIIILISSYYSSIDDTVRTGEGAAYNHSQVKHGKAKEY